MRSEASIAAKTPRGHVRDEHGPNSVDHRSQDASTSFFLRRLKNKTQILRPLSVAQNIKTARKFQKQDGHGADA